MIMKKIRIILLVSFILGLLLFQVKFVAENDNLIIKADIGISEQANAEVQNPSIYFVKEQNIPCSSHEITTNEYYGYKEGVQNDWVLLGVNTWCDGQLVGEYYDYQITGDDIQSVKASSYTQSVEGKRRSCYTGGRNRCTPGDCI